MRILSLVTYYLSFLIAFYAVFSMVLKLSHYGWTFLSHSKMEIFTVALAIVLRVISSKLKPKIPQQEDGRTITKHL
ncbi:hypothetical protein [Pedobacter xixiisoli]|uniref:Uncharacterized protein n=1 Tax=Pedobacter xixiisoli TaxID=1476464 RepID=A0A285ZQ37_9SPHI|nr:hypothetical protein [Pedobacter xixiisoli]SOD11750.1 hypothetical protein SAMN06297358_0315 [Pedobacter xixiisoli]